MKAQIKLPSEIENICKKLASAGFEVAVVGGSVRDLLSGKENHDFDLTTSARPEQILKIFTGAFYNNQFGTVGIPTDVKGEELVFEVTTFRKESGYSNVRHPDKVEWADNVEDDLARRDFTVNAMAVPVAVFADGKKLTEAKLKKNLVDPFNGKKDLANRTLHTPLDPDQTFSDDPLRMMRAVRFASQLDFSIDPKTLESVHKNRERLKIVSAERIQEELFKLMACPKPSIGLTLMWQTHLLDFVLPEVAKLEGVEDVYGHQHKDNLAHTFKVVDNVAEFSDKTLLRLAGLFHDIGKPITKKFIPKIGWTFYQHEHVGKKMVYQVSRRLRFSKNDTDYLAKLVRWHMQPISLMDEGISDSAVRRLVVSLGEELNDLLILGRSDITTGNPAKKERRLKNYDNLEKKIAEVLERDKLRAFQSPLRGDEIMELAKLKPGPTVGKIKEAIEEAILDGIIPNEYEAAKEYFGKIKDKYLADVQEWEKKN